MIPKTAEAMRGVMLRTLWMRVYGDITTAARRRRLTEHDIAQIERRILDAIGDPKDFATQFPEFDGGEVAAEVLKEAQAFFGDCRVARAEHIANEH